MPKNEITRDESPTLILGDGCSIPLEYLVRDLIVLKQGVVVGRIGFFVHAYAPLLLDRMLAGY